MLRLRYLPILSILVPLLAFLFAGPAASADSPSAHAMGGEPSATAPPTPGQRHRHDQLLPHGQPGVQPQQPLAPRLPSDRSATDAPAHDAGTPWYVVVGWGAILAVTLLLTLVATTAVWWMLHAWRNADSLAATTFSRVPIEPRRRFTLLVPARHEEQVLGHTLDRLAATDHPDVEILAIVGDDDPGTEAVARAAAERHPGLIRVVVDDSVPKNKPRGMNTALREATGDVVGVFDAEDDVHPGLLRLVDARFSETEADLVQGGVQLMNLQTTWWSLRNCMEYYFWFRSRLHFHAGARFIPLGGNTVFVRTDLLRAAGGWDGDCLAEDCELGVRLSTYGARVAVVYDPEFVTREETPGSLGSLVRQRTRWSQGFLQVYRKGIWRQLPTRRQRLLASYTLAMPFLQAFSGLMIPVSIALALFAKVPTVLALLTFLPIVPTLVTLVVEAAGLGEFAQQYGVKLRLRDYLRLVIGTFPYQVLLAVAALRAVWRQVRGDSSWEKTEHTGVHLTGTQVTVPAPQEVAR